MNKLKFLFRWLLEDFSKEGIKQMNIKYIYIGDRCSAKTNVITIAYVIENNEIKFGLACSNKLDKYDKQKGKTIALNRLQHDPFNIINIEDKTSYRVVEKLIVDHLLFNFVLAKAPSWAKQLLTDRLEIIVI